MNKPNFITDNDWNLLKKKYKNMDKVIKKLNNNYPVQYLIGNVNFYGYDIFVDKRVLIPRFETETLLEKTINYLKKYNMTDIDCLDIGTGSGDIPIVLKKELPNLTITSIDISKRALKVAKKNIKKNQVDITLINKSIYKYKPINKYNLIISNPPYIDINEEIDPKTKYEPKNALFAKNNGLEYYEYILKNAKKMLKEKYILAFEIGYKQGSSLKNLAKEYFKEAKISIEKDLAGKNRYLFIINV